MILESGAAEFSFDWTLAQRSMAAVTRVCAWDRAGYAWSEMTPDFELFPAVADDMRRLLREAGIGPPWILAGHALGALYARDYQRRFPQEVAGLLLIDPTPEEDFQVKMFGNTVSLIDMADHDLVAWPLRPYAPSRTAPPPRRPTPGDSAAWPFSRLPRDLEAARQWALSRLFDELDALNDRQALAVMESQRATFVELYKTRHNPATSPLKIPVIVLSRGRDATPEIRRMQDELGKLSGDAIHRTADASGEQIQIEQPELVTSAAAEIVRAVRSGSPLAPGR